MDSWVLDSDAARPLPMDWRQYEAAALRRWERLLASDPEESAVQEFLEHHPAMIPGGSGDIGPGGHHHSDFGAVFSQPMLKGLGRDFSPDFMWVTRATSSITPILIEIEKPSKRWFKKDGRPTSDFSHAHDQLNDWRSWFSIDGNRAGFRETFMIEGERYEHRPLKPHYLLIYGRRSEFEPGGGHTDPKALVRKRDGQCGADESFMTFDSIRPRHDHGNSITVKMTATGPRAVALSPVYGTTSDAGQLMETVRDIPQAIAGSEMMTPERRSYLVKRFNRWLQREQESRRLEGPRIHQLGYE